MRKSIRFLVRVMTCAALMLPVFSLGVSANNCKDMDYDFYFTRTVAWTTAEPKLDNSSSYMKCNSAGRSYTAYVYAPVNGKQLDCSMGHAYSFQGGTTHYMLNNVRERGYHGAGIVATRSFSYSYEAHGVWSPDSI